MCQVGHLNPGSHQRVLMKTGLILLIIGHLNFITGALVHGTVLRFVVDPRDAISLQYAIANAASVISALLSSTLTLWAISLLLDSMEIVFSIRCLLLTIDLLHIGCCCRRAHRREVTPGPQAQHRPAPVQGWDRPGWARGLRNGGRTCRPKALIALVSFSPSSLACRSPCRQPPWRAPTLGSAWAC
ncbi:transmembrane protein 54 isoform 5-T6 [Spheniscus humboldti]